MMLDQFRERTQEVTAALSTLTGLADGLGARTLKERVERELLRKLEEDRFHLVVVGEFNHGKTTFVNALLGESALATGVTPTTAAIHHLKYADQPEAAVVRQGGLREPIPFETARRFAVGGGASAEEIDYLEIGYPAPILREGILLVDTPGVNDLSLQRADITYSYIPRADAVLFLLDAGQILKESERVFLNDKLLRASRDKIVFVITKWDLLTRDEQVEALAYAKEQLAKLLKDAVVFPISAELALAGSRETSGLPELLQYLTSFLAKERGRILLDNALGAGLAIALLLSRGVDARRRSLSMKIDELDRRIALLERDLAGQSLTLEQRRSKIREDIVGVKVGARKDLDRFVDELLGQLPGIIDAARADDLKQFFPAFLEDTFKQWAEVETKELAASLESLAEKTIALVREDAHEATKRMADMLGAEPKRLTVEIDTFVYDVGVVALLLGGLSMMFVNVMLGGLLAILGPVLALLLKGRVEDEFKKRAKALAPEVMRQAASRMGPKLDEMIDAFAAKLDAWVVTAGEELHREVLEVLQSTKDGRASGVRSDTTMRTEVEAQAEQLQQATQRLGALRGSLWTAT
ncbi:MAG: dynamin family protein [Myxococcales bacterium]